MKTTAVGAISAIFYRTLKIWLAGNGESERRD